MCHPQVPGQGGCCCRHGLARSPEERGAPHPDSRRPHACTPRSGSVPFVATGVQWARTTSLPPCAEDRSVQPRTPPRRGGAHPTHARPNKARARHDPGRTQEGDPTATRFGNAPRGRTQTGASTRPMRRRWGGRGESEGRTHSHTWLSVRSRSDRISSTISTIAGTSTQW